VVLLTALALMLVLRAYALGLAIASGNAEGLLGSLPGGDDLLVLLTAGVVLWCATPVAATRSTDASATAAVEVPAPSAHAWPIAVAGAVIVGLTVLGWLLVSISNVVTLVTWPARDVGFALLVVEGLLRLAVPVVALVAVISAVRRVATNRRRAASAEPPALPTSATEAEDRPADTAPERLPAAWQADEATGAVWLTADDAAQGRPGLSWSDPESTGPASGGWALPPGPASQTVRGSGGDRSEQGAGEGGDVPTPPGPPNSSPPGPLADTGAVRPAAEDDDLR